MLKKIVRFFRRTPRINEGTRIVISAEKLETRVALLEEGSLEEYSIERPENDNIVGSIFKGRVKNIEQGLKAMFVDIGFDKNAFLHFWDAIPAALGDELEEIQRNDAEKQRSKKRKPITAKDIPTIYPVGAEILVQVTKGPIGSKGPRITTNISLAGRLLVLMPMNEQFGISKKIEDPAERERLRGILSKLTLPEGMSVILRTAATGKRARHIVRDLGILLEQWKKIVEVRDNHEAPVCCFEEPDVIERTVRDFLTDEMDEIVTDDKGTLDRMQGLASIISTRAKKRIRLYQGTLPLFEYYQIQKQIDNAFFRQVWLPCGGYLVIDETEAMVTVDVNTGRNKGSKDMDKMIFDTNMEAAHEVSRQLRLRNIGGLVVVDFIDMRNRKDRQNVYNVMKERLKRDKAKTQILPISELGLMEMTRQRLNESLSVSLNETCSYCNGRGRVKSTLTMSVELQRRLSRVLSLQPEQDRDMIVVVHPDVLQRLRSDDEILVEFERRYQCRLTFRSDPSSHRETVSILNARTMQELDKV